MIAPNKLLQKHNITKQPPCLPLNYFQVTVIQESLPTRTDNPDRLFLN